MFKVAFPWAAKTEEKEERDYLYTLETTSQDDVAGNVWIEPEYGMYCAALLQARMWLTWLQHWN